MLSPIVHRARVLLRRLGYDVIRYGSKPGTDHLSDIARLLDGPPLVLDVGANRGQTARAFLDRFPDATVHSFEPSPTTFEELRTVSGIVPHNIALGAEVGSLTLHENVNPTMSSFLPLTFDGWGAESHDTQVAVRTVDDFCSEHGIERVDVLKSDTQGFDLEVLRGAEAMLRSGAIRMVFLEVIFSAMYEGAPAFSVTFDHLTERGYRLVALYDARYRDGVIDFADALFAHQPAALGE